ncbi:thermonuclease family protein [Amphibiibacter pelophylacis]|uniref:Thermonuclease family protein n=1 Tax=Amphibiibacter pelophylacis TaxID=1799477 RepID=A0ACC6P1N0_9BURK
MTAARLSAVALTLLLAACSAAQSVPSSRPGLGAEAPGLARASARTPPLAACPLRWATVDRVSDGDTIRVWLDGEPAARTASGKPRSTSVRLLGLDAPETCQSGGAQATQALRGWLPPGRRIALTNACQADRYGRLLATVHLDGLSVNAALLDAGLAWHWTGSQPTGQPRGDTGFASRQARAQQQRLGVFADPLAQSPWDFRRTHGPC